jgi:hypothetical protein
MFRVHCQLLSVLLLFAHLAQNALAQKLAAPISKAISKGLSEMLSARGENQHWPVHRLNLQQSWQLDTPNGRRFDASGLCWTQEGLLTLDDKQQSLFRIHFGTSTSSAAISPATNSFSSLLLRPWISSKTNTFDFEGLARDDNGRLYLCEEQRRAIFRFDPSSNQLELLPIDWSPVSKFFSKTDRNASFEGVAVGNGKLYVANERSQSRIIVVDLRTLKVTAHFQAKGAAFSLIEPHYSDLCFFQGRLFALLRHQETILEIDPATTRVLAEYEFGSIENAPEVAYLKDYPTGAMEGLAVTADYFYLVTDNNGKGRSKYPSDHRPTLFRCARPEAKLKGN